MAWRKPSNLREWFRIIFRHKKKVAFPCLLVMIIAVVASFWIPRKYNAQARFQRSNDSALRQMGNATISGNLGVFRRRLRQDLTSRDAIEKLINDLDMTKGFARDRSDQLTRQGQMEKEDLIRKIRSSITVGYEISADQIDQIVVSFVDTNQTNAPKIANQLVQNYIADTRREMDRMLIGAQEFFAREVTKFSGRVFELEKKRLDYERDHPGLDPQSPNNLRALLVQRRHERETAEKGIRMAEEKRRAQAELLDGMDEFVETEKTGPNPRRQMLEARLQQLFLELDHNLTTLGRLPAHPAVIKLNTQIQSLQDQIQQEPEFVDMGIERTPNQGKLSVEQEVRRLDGEIAALTEQRDKLMLQIEDLEIQDRNYFQVRNEFLKIEAELSDALQQLKFWDSNLQRTQVALQTEISQRGVRLRQIERAEDQPRPSSPTLFMILGLALALGLGTGFCCLIVAELMDHTFQSVEQAVDELKLPVLGAVNEIVTPAEGFKRRILDWGVYPTVTTALVVVLVCSLIVTYLNLQHPVRFEQLRGDPAGFVSQVVFGGTGR